MNHDEAAKLIGPYRDGELDLTTCLQLEEHLAGCPECQQKLTGQHELVEAIRSETSRFTPSPFLKTRIQAKLREQSSAPAAKTAWNFFPLAWSGFGVAVAICVVWGVGFLLKPQVPGLDQEAIANHVRSLQASHLMDVASTDQHTVKPWFAGKLDYSPQVIDLSPSGYPLIGGRLDVLDHRNVAAIIYQRRKHYINLFIWPSGESSLPGGFQTQDGYHAISWTKSGMNYLAVSELGEKELHDFVDMIQTQTIDSRPGE